MYSGVQMSDSQIENASILHSFLIPFNIFYYEWYSYQQPE